MDKDKIKARKDRDSLYLRCKVCNGRAELRGR